MKLLCERVYMREKVKMYLKWWTENKTQKNEWKNFGYKAHWMRINVKCVSDKSIRTWMYCAHMYRESISIRVYVFAITQLATALLLHSIVHHMRIFTHSVAHSMRVNFHKAPLFSPAMYDSVAIFPKNHQFVIHTQPARISMKNFCFTKISVRLYQK